ncbi:MAG: CotH kinase family protein, partial [Ruminococcus sp.]|nr:CotH kinase family protein [Ruminococcus sp.]
MKRLCGIFLSIVMVLSVFAAAPASAEKKPSAPAFKTAQALYAHAVLSSEDGEAWLKWQSKTIEGSDEIEPSVKYFFLPSCSSDSKLDVYNGFSTAVDVGGVVIEPSETAEISYSADKELPVKAGEESFTLKFMRSNAEAAIYVNGTVGDLELTDYLNETKSNSAKATGAIVTPDGKIDNTPIKKIKGRGNTTWLKPKKAYNITYDSKVSIAGMNEGKKFSILANYQDDSLARNRILYDLSDAVGMPYASDSRFVDFYSNGKYLGSYQLCEKIEVGKNTLVPDFSEKDYLDKDGNVKEDFPFLCEVDAGAQDGEDYYVKLSNGLKITIKAPELEEGDKGYDEVKSYVKSKFEA